MFERSTTWRYSVCGLLLCATMLLYMDRQTLSQLATTICTEYSLSNEQYGWLDTGFSFAFASGAIIFGFLVDRLSPRWLYPAVVVGWSCAGLATAYAQTIGSWFFPASHPSEQAYYGFMLCRITLGFFESGHWPCALVTTQIILTRSDRSLGNSILQSGAAIGAIVTPIIVLTMLTDRPGGWQPPFVVIGCIGFFWGVPWLLLVRGSDLDRRVTAQEMLNAPPTQADHTRRDLWRMFAVLVVIVICINLTWQYFRVWLPKYLEESHGYTKVEVGWFTSAYYISTDVGCISVGFLVKWLTTIGWDVHRARLITFTACAGLTLLAVAVAFMPTGPLLLIVLLFVGAGTLGLYPNYYAFTQELSKTHQGKISGMLGTIAWCGSAIMQALVGRSIDETKSYVIGIVMAGLAPLLACTALWLFWQRRAAPSNLEPSAGPVPMPSTVIKEVPDQSRKA
jgi:ACS family hexuronate transporter-like MFS transporter